jgi:hypothetical protein
LPMVLLWWSPPTRALMLWGRGCAAAIVAVKLPAWRGPVGSK